ncbi:MAG: AMMECR1 domain-containing protein [Nitrospirae bacterium]|nr:AMMECR1 domain-containing protein [Nitrospirota bacterium]
MPPLGRVLQAVLAAAFPLLLPARSDAATEASAAWAAARDAILTETGYSSSGPPAFRHFSSSPAAGTIVTLSRAGRTRACQGSLHPEAVTLDEEAVRLARTVAAGDPRYPAVRSSELPGLTLRVSLVRAIHPVARPDALNPSRDGLWLRGGEGGEKNAIILPGEAKTARYMADEAARRARIRAGDPVEWFRLVLEWHEAPLAPTTSLAGGQ